MKPCTKCGNLKLLADFGKRTASKDGLNSWCNVCTLDYANKYFKLNSVRLKAVQRNIYKKNPERAKIRVKKWQQENLDNLSAYKRERNANDPLYKLAGRLRSRTWLALKSKKWQKTSHLTTYIGCTLEELKAHLEKQFLPEMTWNNHSPTGWHIDHIIPLDSAATEEEMYKLCHYTNLQPLWADDNIRKSNKINSLKVGN